MKEDLILATFDSNWMRFLSFLLRSRPWPWPGPWLAIALVLPLALVLGGVPGVRLACSTFLLRGMVLGGQSGGSTQSMQHFTGVTVAWGYDYTMLCFGICFGICFGTALALGIVKPLVCMSQYMLRTGYMAESG